MAKKLELLNDEDNIYCGPTDDEVRKYLNVDPTKCRHGYVHTRHCPRCAEMMLSIAMAELVEAKGG
jgi:hypothetical protein